MINILLVTQDDPFYIPVFFKELFKHNLTKKFNLLGVIIQPPLGKKSMKKLMNQMLNFYGLRNFIIVGLKFVLFKILNILSIKIFKGKFPGVFSTEHILLKNDVTIFKIKNINSKDSLNFLRSLNLDVIFSVAASQIFKSDLLELPKLGCFNIHTSKLPKNRGMLPNFWSLYNYDLDNTSAITIHKMNEKLDDGEILLQQEFNLNPSESLETLIKKTKKMSSTLFLKAMDILSSGKPHYLKNDNQLLTYNTFPNKNDVKKFTAKGLKLR